ncbi:MAG: hypothetical protein Q4G35_00290 [Propionibacteriaceae bacterium]|nr:hypothetical protein [Propionibacteriaceae bacterium]
MSALHHTIGLIIQALAPARHDERGLSQSTENAILLAGAAAVAAIIIAVITEYVTGKLPG